MKVGVVCVHFHAAGLAVDAMAAVRRDLEESGLGYELLVVDNGSTEEERRTLDAGGVRVISTGGNVGYAGGVNLGARTLLPGVDVLVVMNPDVMVSPGCLERLVQEIRDGAAVAGPRFFWDEIGGYQLPPTEAYGRLAELRKLAAARGGIGRAYARRAWRRHAMRHWRAEATLTSWDLSGALLALSAEAWSRVGPFDEGYRLYFEETDWLYRCRRTGLPGRFVVAAEAVHLYAQSTPREPRAHAWFVESSERFRRLHYGETFSAWLGRAARWSSSSDGEPGPSIDPRAAAVEDREVGWVEISPSPQGFPAAGKKVEGPFAPLVSDRLWEQMAPGTYWVRTVSVEGRESPPSRFVKEPRG